MFLPLYFTRLGLKIKGLEYTVRFGKDNLFYISCIWFKEKQQAKETVRAIGDIRPMCQCALAFKCILLYVSTY